MTRLKPAALFILALLIVGAPGQTDLGNATALQAVTQVVICLALIALIARPKVVMLCVYKVLLRLHRAVQGMPRNVQAIRRQKG